MILKKLKYSCKNFIFTLFGIFLANISLAQIQFKSFDDNIGYCSHSFQIIQDDYGFLWSGTLTGLVKTDGYQYTKFTNDPSDNSSIATNFSSCLYEDRFSNIWVNSHLFGISIYDRSKDEFFRIKAGDHHNLQLKYITDFYEVNDSTVYICGDNGLQRVTIKNENYQDVKFDHYSLPDSLKKWNTTKTHLWDIEALPNGHLIISSIMGFFIFDTDQQIFYNHNTHPWLPDGLGYSSWVDTTRQQIWFAEADKTIKVVDMVSKSVDSLEFIRAQSSETYMSPMNDSTLLMRETGNDLKIINLLDYSFKSYIAGANSEIGFKDQWSRRFCQTDDGSIFIASDDKSRFQHIPSIHQNIKSFQILDSKNNNTSSVFEDEDYFAASFDGNGFFIVDKSSDTKRHFTTANSELEDNLIMHIDRLADGKFLIMGKPYAYIFNPIQESLQILSEAFFFRNALQLDNGDLWLFPGGGSPLHWFEMRNGIYRRKVLPESLRKIPNVRDAIQEKDGTIWLISSVEGFFQLNQEFEIVNNWKSNVTKPNALVGNALECMFLDSKNRLWLGTLEGLSIYNNSSQTFTNFTQKDGLDDTSISDIIEDKKGQIWISSFDGLYKFIESENKIERLPKSHTLNQHFSQRGFFRFNQYIYAAGWDGIDIITTDSSAKNTIPPIVQLTGIYSSDQERIASRNLEIQNELNFSSAEKNASLEFAAIHYGSDSDKTLQYRIKPSNSWIRLNTQRTISLSNIPFGNHTLEIRASNGDGIWSSPKTYSVILARPWYTTWWFYTLTTVFILGLLYAIYHWRISKMRRYQEKQLKIDKQIAEIELKALKAQINPHFVFNSLNSVKALVLEKKTGEAVTYLTSFSNLIRKILNNSNDKFIRLQDELETVKLYLKLESLRFEDAFSYSINVDEQVSIDFIEVPSLILQPYIENAIWHGLLPKENGEKWLKISIDKVMDMIHITIVDNGIGRIASQKLKTRSKSKNKSLGMKINEQRIDLLKKLYGKDTSIEIVDLMNGNNAAGTKIILKFYVSD